MVSTLPCLGLTADRLRRWKRSGFHSRPSAISLCHLLVLPGTREREGVIDFWPSHLSSSWPAVDDLRKVVGEAEDVKVERRTEKSEEMGNFVKFQHPLRCRIRMLETRFQFLSP